ncbi:MAG: type II toxin-antitoxin system VapC family toxin [Terriglobales bacterium]
MTLVDTSVWIDLIRSGRPGQLGETLATFATCGPVLQELLQGLGHGPNARQLKADLLAFPVLSDPLPRAVFLDAAAIYRQGRERGLTIRSSVDCLISAIAIANQVSLWHRDRDYDRIAEFTPLRVVRWH